jgi:hypothetical protein
MMPSPGSGLATYPESAPADALPNGIEGEVRDRVGCGLAGVSR